MGFEFLIYVVSIFVVNLYNFMWGVVKIWDRFNDKYGCFEVVEVLLKVKFLVFLKNEC